MTFSATRKAQGMFSEKELAYLQTQRLARIATVSTASQPDVAPVGFDFDGVYFYVGGLDLSRTLKYKNIQVNPKVSLVIDDLETVEPWKPRGIKIHGIADIITREGYVGSGRYIRIKPEVKWHWGIEEPATKDGKPNIKKTTA
jgi:pyridoxamine 5'-phosphate oxidase family protein